MENTNIRLSQDRKRQLDHDLMAIGIITFLVLVLVVGVLGKQFNCFVYDTNRSVLPRVSVAAICGQYALAGLGITSVCVFRKEKFTKFGLNAKKWFPLWP